MSTTALRRILAKATWLQRYIAEEIATDHVESLLTRREAMTRLALLGVGTAAASALISACSTTSGSTSTSKPRPPCSVSTEPWTPA